MLTPGRIVRGIARRAEARGRRALLRAATHTRTVAYGTDARQVLDLMRPRFGARRTTVVVFHGGGWREGSRASMIDRVCARYLAHGCVVANVGYRHGVVLANADAVRALAWVQDNLGDDVIVTGESAGAQLALTAAFTAVRPVRAVVDFYAPTDLASFAHARADRSVHSIEQLQALSPLAHVRPGLCPVIAIHGAADPLVPLEHTTRLVRALRDAGVIVHELVVAGGGHGFLPHQLDAIFRQVFEHLW